MNPWNLEQRLVLDSTGTLVTEVALRHGSTVFWGCPPRGTTTGQHDRSSSAPEGFGLQAAAEALAGVPVTDQQTVDNALEDLSATGDLDVRMMTAISLASVQAGASLRGIHVWQHVSDVYSLTPQLPSVITNVLAGGGHDISASDITEAMFTIEGHPRNTLALAAKLRRAVQTRIQGLDQSPLTGREGAWVSPVGSSETLALMSGVIDDHADARIGIAVDMAANWFDQQGVGPDQLAPMYREWVKSYPVRYIEDPFADDNLEPWSELVDDIGEAVLIVGDDLLGSQRARLVEADDHGAVNASVVKFDQCGTITCAAQLVQEARTRDIPIVVSHRSRESDSSITADLAVGFGADWLKAGAAGRERITKYNRLLRIAHDDFEDHAA